ncbi:alpha/beta fold hydrolase [Coralloluteibacterium thermophilus]|uniref:Alpha/beta fold hydrolase n=1 Tax=Coralloluteibacterium thermophilum TaxID=2707049 RepID=A0ABV9NI39_9GAMM
MARFRGAPWALVTIALLALAPGLAFAQACRDAVVLVHGNTGTPSQFDNTYQELLRRGWSPGQIFRPDWGSKICAACNDHAGSETVPVDAALVDAAAASCTGRIDVIGHSMGATLAASRIQALGMQGYVDAFVGIAGAFRGLRSCGTYPWNVATTTCGAQGLSMNSPLVNSLANRSFGARMYSIKSYADQVVCLTGVCTVGGVHSSRIDGEDGSDTYVYGHFGLLEYTAARQVDLIQ